MPETKQRCPCGACEYDDIICVWYVGLACEAEGGSGTFFCRSCGTRLNPDGTCGPSAQQLDAARVELEAERDLQANALEIAAIKLAIADIEPPGNAYSPSRVDGWMAYLLTEARRRIEQQALAATAEEVEDE